VATLGPLLKAENHYYEDWLVTSSVIAKDHPELGKNLWNAADLTNGMRYVRM